MLEQAVSKRNNAGIKRMKLILRITQVVVLVLMLVGEVLGFTLSGVIYSASQTMFWQWIAMMVLMAIPALVLAAILEVIIRRRSIEFDYELKDTNVIVYRLVYGKRKLYLTFDLGNVSAIRAYDTVASNPLHRQDLKKSVIACCNYDDENLMCINTTNCTFKRRKCSTMIIMEPNEAFRQVFQRSCKSVMA